MLVNDADLKGLLHYMDKESDYVFLLSLKNGRDDYELVITMDRDTNLKIVKGMFDKIIKKLLPDNTHIHCRRIESNFNYLIYEFDNDQLIRMITLLQLKGQI